MKIDEKVIRYPNEDGSKMYDSIEKILSAFEGKQVFRLHPKCNDTVYIYDFYDNGIVTVYVASKPNHNVNDRQFKHPVTVHLLGFEQNSFYNKLYDELSDLKKKDMQK
jgi:hypothetical protein